MGAFSLYLGLTAECPADLSRLDAALQVALTDLDSVVAFLQSNLELNRRASSALAAVRSAKMHLHAPDRPANPPALGSVRRCHRPSSATVSHRQPWPCVSRQPWAGTIVRGDDLAAMISAEWRL